MLTPFFIGRGFLFPPMIDTRMTWMRRIRRIKTCFASITKTLLQLISKFGKQKQNPFHSPHSYISHRGR
jgi:hypothetical protein